MSDDARRSLYIGWDVRNWGQALDFWCSRSWLDLSNSRVLEIGANAGGLSLWLAEQGASVVCSDRGAVREAAVLLHRTSTVGDRIEYAAVDATAIPYASSFDIVVFKSVLGAVGTWDAQHRALEGMHAALRPGGELWFAENLAGSPVHMALRRRLVRWGTSWRYITIEEMRILVAPFATCEMRMAGVTGTFGRTERQRNVLGIADRLVLDRLTPDRWKYIVMGVARKAPAAD